MTFSNITFIYEFVVLPSLELLIRAILSLPMSVICNFTKPNKRKTYYVTVDVPVYRPPVYRFALFTGVFFRATPSPRFTGGMPVYRGGSFFHARGAPPAAAHSHTRCCTQHNTTRWVAYHLRKAKMDFIHARYSKPAVQADIRAMFSDS